MASALFESASFFIQVRAHTQSMVPLTGVPNGRMHYGLDLYPSKLIGDTATDVRKPISRRNVARTCV